MSTVPATSVLSGTPTWSSGALFDGYLYLGLVLPQDAAGQYATTALAGQMPPQRLPVWTVVPIQAGVFDQHTKVFQNGSIQPPNSQYVAYWYDQNLRRVFPAAGVSPTPFSIATNPYAISIPTLTVPTSSLVLPATTDTSANIGATIIQNLGVIGGNTNIVPQNAPVANALLVVRGVIDGVGGYTITWDSSFTNPPVVDTTANAPFAAIFYAVGSQWSLAAIPVL